MSNHDKRELLFVEGHIPLAGPESEPVEIRRGMIVMSREGSEAGQVAALVVDGDSLAVTHVLLVRWRAGLDYRLLPVGLVAAVNDGVVRLAISDAAIDKLPVRAAA